MRLPAVTGSTVCWAGVVVDTLGSTQLQHSTISHLLGNNVNKCDYWCGSFYYLFSPHREAGAGKHTQNTDRGDPPSHGHTGHQHATTQPGNLKQTFLQSRRRPLLGPSPGWKRLLFLPKRVLLWQLSRGGCFNYTPFKPEIPACSDNIFISVLTSYSFLFRQAILFLHFCTHALLWGSPILVNLLWCFRCVLDILCACL